MRPLIALFGPFAVIASLAGCARPAADWTFTAFDNFDPSQVAMIPANPHQPVPAHIAGSTSPTSSATIARP